jgi:hypothetical protein
MKKQSFNPYLPSWEYVPDGEPYIFEGRVYIYGSHDRAHGYVFCQNDYVCWSAPVDDLGDWRYEGVIYPRTADPLNKDGHMCLYAPDVTVGPDGRYYLYYNLDKTPVVSVAVCDTPAGKYKFYGYVRYADGTILGEREGDEPQFDPGVLTEGAITYLYTGFAYPKDSSRTGAMATVLGPDMLTITEEPVFVIPSSCYSKGTGFEGYEFFEAPSIRKNGDTYYLIYSSAPNFNMLCYATSKYPTKDFKFGGPIISNCDLNIDTYKPADKRVTQEFNGNNHGSIIDINGQWYIFYHRHTNGTWFSRQGCVEKIEIKEDGSISQVEITSQGANGVPLIGKGTYPSYIACHLFNEDPSCIKRPRITQDGRDKDECEGFIADVSDQSVIGFKYFEFENAKRITIRTRGYSTGLFEVRTSFDGEVLGIIPIGNSNIWTEASVELDLPNGVYPLYFTYKGTDAPSFGAFTIE